VSPISQSGVRGKRLIIAIDGPAASGKSTTARLVAERLGYLHLDTGAMYRAITLKVLRSGLSLTDNEGIANLALGTHIELRTRNSSLRVFMDGEDVSEQIRTVDVTNAVSAVSSIREVRQAMVREQQRIGEEGSVVLEGRDIGTQVFPGADLKIFMVAGIETRARRRQVELRAMGIEKQLDHLMDEIKERDRLDSTRGESPLRRAPDAVEIDTSNLRIDEQVEFVVKKAKEILKQLPV